MVIDDADDSDNMVDADDDDSEGKSLTCKAHVSQWVCKPTLSSAVSSRVRYNRSLSRMSLVCYHHHHHDTHHHH